MNELVVYCSCCCKNNEANIKSQRSVKKGKVKGYRANTKQDKKRTNNTRK